MDRQDHNALDERAPLLRRSTSQTSYSFLTPGGVGDIDSRFKRWKEAVAHRMRKGKYKASDEPEVLVSVFDGTSHAVPARAAATLTDEDLARDVDAVRKAILEGLPPKMIQTGSSGSYFARRRRRSSSSSSRSDNDASCPAPGPDHGQQPITCGVFKPSDEEPYGNLNPKRAFLRKYFWWAMGRPCLIAGFSAMSEAGASLLDDRLRLGMVPKTKLVALSSPSFHYAYKDRVAWEFHGQPLPEKIGSFRSFLHGYVMASTFLRQHPFPTRPRSVLERDLAAEQRAHRKARKQYKARLRKCGVRVKYMLLCRQGFEDIQYDPSTEITAEELARTEEENAQDDGFLWTPDLIDSFRLELEKLVVFDYLCRNTDRGLDNFMVKHIPSHESNGQQYPPSIRLGAIDNSLAWPIKHPDGIREYPYGWLFLPADLIGGPFSQATRDHFLGILSDPRWWHDTEEALHSLFKEDEHFNEKLFESQMAVFKGQGWNLVQCLRASDEGPLELCARPKKVVHKSVVTTSEGAVLEMEGTKVPLKGGLTWRLTGNEGAAVPAAKTTATALPMAVPIAAANGGGRGQGADDAPASAKVPTLGEGAHPRSLPETSTLSLRTGGESQAWGQLRQLSAGGALPTVRGRSAGTSQSLGIDVLEDLDRAARRSKSGRRALFGRTPSSSQQDARSRPGGGGGSAPTAAQPEAVAAARRGDLEQGIEEEAEEDEGEGEDAQSRDEVMSENDASLPPSPTLSPQAQARMTSSDYFAYGTPGRRSGVGSRTPGWRDRARKSKDSGGGAGGVGGVGAAGAASAGAGVGAGVGVDALPSIATALSQAQTQTPAAHAHAHNHANGNGNGNGNGSGPAHSQQQRRRRNWSVSSFASSFTLSRDVGDAGPTTNEGAGHGQGQAKSARPVKVIVERLVDDKSVPWQARLRA